MPETSGHILTAYPTGVAGSVFGAAEHGSVHFGPLDALLHPLYNLAILLLIVSAVVLLWYGFAGCRRYLTHCRFA